MVIQRSMCPDFSQNVGKNYCYKYMTFRQRRVKGYQNKIFTVI